MKRENHIRQTIRILLCLVLTGVLFGAILSRKYYWTGWQFISRSSSQVDLCGSPLTFSDYQRIQNSLPDCEIVWNVPFQGSVYPSTIQTLQVNSLTQEDLSILDYFTELTFLDASDCTDYDQLLAFQSRHPECDILCQVQMGSNTFRNDVTQLSLKDISADALSYILPLLKNVKHVQLTGLLPTADELRQLRLIFPSVCFRWEVPLEGSTIDSSVRELDLSEKQMSFDEALAIIDYLPELETVDMRHCGLSDEEMMCLSRSFPDCFFLWDMEVAGLRFSTNAQEIDISGQVVESREQIETVLPFFPNLQRVIMCRTGLDDETMDALNKSYTDIRFVWSVRIKDVYVRTDSTYFYPFKFYRKMQVNTTDLYPLRYCTDMVCIDIGHMGEVTDCEWAAFMPELQYLILGETRISDLTPLSNCKKLAFLELFTIPVTDYSPLVECTGLEDLNLGRTYGDPTPLTKMTWLKNLWWANVDGTYGLPCSNAKQVLTEALPNTRMRFDIAHPTAGGWRQLDNYFAMRDLMGMFYLP